MPVMELAEYEGQIYGPNPLRVSVDAVADFVEVTGDDENRWTSAAPPGFAAAALFVVAPELLDQLSDRSIIHGEQSFTWHNPIEIGTLLSVSGSVSRVRERSGVNFVTFEMSAKHEGKSVVDGSSLFLVSGESIPGGSDFERPEPPHSYRGSPTDSEVGASRADLIRYAAATRDWNPVHWDHDAGVVAGFPGVVAHGLLQAAWALVAASKLNESQMPFASARVRFRNPLLPARPVRVSTDHDSSTVSVTISDLDDQYITARIELADE